MSEQAPQFPMQTNRLSLDSPKVYHIPQWDYKDDKQKLAVIRKIVEQYGRDPRVTTTAIRILREEGIQPREYKKQAKAFLEWVQTNLYYVNEPGERLQSPLYTLKVGYGDCDDLAIVLCSFFEAVRLPWKLVISGRYKGKTIRYQEGDKVYPRAQYAHIYCMVGNRPFTPTEWYYCEPTLKAKLGWDVVAAAEGKAEPLHKLLPELGNPLSATASKVKYQVSTNFTEHTKDIAIGAVVGALTVVLSELMLEMIKSTDWYQKTFKKRKK